METIILKRWAWKIYGSKDPWCHKWWWLTSLTTLELIKTCHIFSKFPKTTDTLLNLKWACGKIGWCIQVSQIGCNNSSTCKELEECSVPLKARSLLSTWLRDIRCRKMRLKLNSQITWVWMRSIPYQPQIMKTSLRNIEVALNLLLKSKSYLLQSLNSSLTQKFAVTVSKLWRLYAVLESVVSSSTKSALILWQ